MATEALATSTADRIMASWSGIIGDDFATTISNTFGLPPAQDDDYVYRADNFGMTMAQILDQLKAGKLQYKYMAHGKPIEACQIVRLGFAEC